VNRPIALLLASLALVPAIGRAQPASRSMAASTADTGFIVTVDAGVGGSIGTGSQYTRSGILEAEIGAGYELPYGLRPELALVLGAAPRGHVGLRPGIHVIVLDTPFYVRAAVDWSTARAEERWRWILLGGGGELRFTGFLGGFAELDLGIPLAHDVGAGVLARAGFSFRF
jgi:hypothetical protein